MKWVLVSGFDNPGDEWARMGVVEIIRDTDPKAVLVEVDKFDPDINTPITCDRVVFCGQPLLWAHPDGDVRDIHWWPAINGWMAEGNKLIIAGFGIFLQLTAAGHPVLDHAGPAIEAVRNLLGRCRAAWCRNQIGRELLGAEVFPCPSIFSHRFGVAASPTKHRLCNFSIGGGHEWARCPEFSEGWYRHHGDIAGILIKYGFIFAAHHADEARLAVELGWPESRIAACFENPSRLLETYAMLGGKYFGNRVHGAIITRSFGGDAVLCGQDTRMGAAEMLGAKVFQQNKLDVEWFKWFKQWASGKTQDAPSPIDINGAFEQAKRYFA